MPAQTTLCSGNLRTERMDDGRRRLLRSLVVKVDGIGCSADIENGRLDQHGLDG